MLFVSRKKNTRRKSDPMDQAMAAPPRELNTYILVFTSKTVEKKRVRLLADRY